MIEIGNGLFGLLLVIAIVYAIVKKLGIGASTGAKLLWVLIILAASIFVLAGMDWSA